MNIFPQNFQDQWMKYTSNKLVVDVPYRYVLRKKLTGAPTSQEYLITTIRCVCVWVWRNCLIHLNIFIRFVTATFFQFVRKITYLGYCQSITEKSQITEFYKNNYFSVNIKDFNCKYKDKGSDVVVIFVTFWLTHPFLVSQRKGITGSLMIKNYSATK